MTLLPTKAWFACVAESRQYREDLDHGYVETVETLKPRWEHNLEVTRATSAGLRAARTRSIQDRMFLFRVKNQEGARFDTCSERFARLDAAGYLDRSGGKLRLTAAGERHFNFLRGIR